MANDQAGHCIAKGSRSLVVCFACNDDQGNYDGRARGFSIRGYDGWDVEFDHDDPIHGRVFKVDWTMLTFTIHRVAYPFTSHRQWIGNMAWDGFRMKRPQALRLLLAINDQPEWTCSGGAARVCEWLDRKRAERAKAAA